MLLESLPPLPPGFVLPFIYGEVSKACAFVGISETQFYLKWAVLDPELVIQNGERTLVDLPRLVRRVGSMPRGKRQPLGKPRPGRRQTPPKSARSLLTD
jgi:hypothetical protein